MVLTYGTTEGIDLQVANGYPVGYFGTDDDLTKLPKQIGDWLIKISPDAYRHGVGTLVGVPTNRRTRKIYTKGRIAWLKGLGFSEANAWTYLYKSQRNKRRWDQRVAMFVNENFNLDPFIIADILDSDCPRKECLGHGIYTTMHHGQIISALQILSEIHPC